MSTKAYEEVALESSGPGGSLQWKQEFDGHWHGTTPDEKRGYFDVVPMRGGGFHTWWMFKGTGNLPARAVDLGHHQSLGAAFGAARDFLDGAQRQAAESGARDGAYPQWTPQYSNEEFDRVQRLAYELTAADRAAGRAAPSHGYSAERFKDAERIVRAAMRSSANESPCGCPGDKCAHHHPPEVPTHACAEAAGDPSAMPAPGELPMVKVVAENPATFAQALKDAEAYGPIDTPEKAYHLLAGHMNKSDQEQLIVVCTNLHGKVLGISEVNRGERESVNASMTQIMRVALNTVGASAFFIAHNHPTGKAKPSKADRDLTESVKEACKPYRELAFVDHIVIGQSQFFSIEEKKKYTFKR